MADLVLLRHGESLWNSENRFTGWIDVDLSPQGELEARQAGRVLGALDGNGGRPAPVEVVHTSVLTRAVRTANLALDEAGRSWVPVRRHWRLNERHYGALQGLDKDETLERYGEDQFLAWRRGYATTPPALDPGDERHPSRDLRYRLLSPEVLPATECLADVVRRMLPYYEDAIVPDLRAFRTVLVVAHGNSLRALVKALENISDDDIVTLEIPTGAPRLYRLDDNLAIAEVSSLASS